MKQLSAQLSVLVVNLDFGTITTIPDFPPMTWRLAEDISLAIRSKLNYKEANIDHLVDEL